jgi:predicted amidohydrolase YtcJ
MFDMRTTQSLVHHARLGACVALLVAGCAPAPASPLKADTLLIGSVRTLSVARPTADAIAVKGGRIIAIGSLADVSATVGPETRRIRLTGVGVPGLADAHVHALELGEQLEMLDLRGLNKQEVLHKVAERARSLPPHSWLEGKGWDQGFFQPSIFPAAADIDAVAPDHPVVLTRIDGHSVWVNSAALDAAQISHDAPDPVGGRLLRNLDGSPSGVLVDSAVSLVTQVMPAPTHDQRLRRLEAALAQYVRWGLTSVHDAGVDLAGIALYKELLAAHRLPLRAYVMGLGSGETAEQLLARVPETGLGDHRLTIRSLKVYLDGALGSRGAELLLPYSDAPREAGLELTSDAALMALLRAASARGYQVSAHAIGDRAVRRALDAVESSGTSPDERFRIEHASVVAPADQPRFSRLHVIASMQPGFVGEYSRWALERLGVARIESVLPVRTLLARGTVVAAGSDYPAADSGNPIQTLSAMVTRRGADGTPVDGWHSGQAISTEAALRAMTWAPAFASFEENDLGVLEVGRLADVTVLSADPLRVPPRELETLTVTMTIVGGVPIFEAPPLKAP